MMRKTNFLALIFLIFTVAAQAAQESKFLSGFEQYRKTTTVQTSSFGDNSRLNMGGLRQIDRHTFRSKQPVESRTYLRFGLAVYKYDSVDSAKTAFDDFRQRVQEGTYKSPEYILLKGEKIYWLSGACLYSRQKWDAIESKLQNALLMDVVGKGDDTIKVLCGGTVGIGNGENPTLLAADKIVYRFGDSSVPPQYHRSYTITVTKSDAKLVIDSYGTIVNESTISITDKEFNEVIETIRAGKIAKRAAVKNDNGCSGGTSESLALFRGNNKFFDADIYHCGGKDQGTLAGNIKAVKDKVKALFPNFRGELK